MSAMGLKIAQFDVPVCNSFQAKILNDQLCYEVDLNTFSNKSNIKNELDLGFSIIMDYNEDRQVRIEDVHTKRKEAKTSFVRRIDESDSADGAYIYLNTIGTYIIWLYTDIKMRYSFPFMFQNQVF